MEFLCIPFQRISTQITCNWTSSKVTTVMLRISAWVFFWFLSFWVGAYSRVRAYSRGTLSQGALILLLQLYMKFASVTCRNFVTYYHLLVTIQKYFLTPISSFTQRFHESNFGSKGRSWTWAYIPIWSYKSNGSTWFFNFDFSEIFSRNNYTTYFV